MINGKLVSIGSILWRVLRNPLVADLTPDYAAELAMDFLKQMSAPLSLSDKVDIVEIYEYKAVLPPNVIYVKGVGYIGDDRCNTSLTPMRYASNVYHVSNEDNSTPNQCGVELTYVLQECNIITSVRSGFLKVAYKEIATDEQGFPLIPDNESFKKALEYHIIFKYLEPLWVVGKVADKVFSYYDTQSMWYFGQAENIFKLGNIDQLETVMNSINRILVTATAHSNGFKNIGEKEIIKKYY